MKSIVSQVLPEPWTLLSELCFRLETAEGEVVWREDNSAGNAACPHRYAN